MGRRKKGRGGGGGAKQPTTNRFWSNIPQNRTLGEIKPGQNTGQTTSGPAGFQAPHHQQDTILDLTDDTSPNIPMKNSGGKKAEGISFQGNQGPQEKKQDIQSKSPIIIGLNPVGENKQDNKNPQTANIESNTQKNVSQNVTTRSGIVQGVASDIKLFSTKTVAVKKDTPTSTTNATSSSSTLSKGVTVQETKNINSPKSMPQTSTANKPTTSTSKVPVGKSINTRISRLTGITPTKNKAEPKNKGVTPTPAPAPQPERRSLLGTPPPLPALRVPMPTNQSFSGVTPTPAPAPQPERRSLLGTPPPLPALRRPMPTNQSFSRFPPDTQYSYPKGIPRSFFVGAADVPLPYANIQNVPDVSTSQNWPQQPQSQTAPTFVPMQSNEYGYNYQNVQETPHNSMYVDTETGPVEQQAYSPSDVYDEAMGTVEEERAGSESPDMLEAGQKRLSAFQRLGPMTQPKKPKMTINLLCNKDQSVREVVDETEQKYVPVHLREDIINSKDETVMKYLKLWPWDKGLPVRKTVMARVSKSVMLLEHEQMEEVYEKDWLFIQISVQGYPREWTKEKLLDTLLDFVNGKNLVPIFIEFAPTECKFLVIRCRAALNAIHKAGFVVRKDNVELTLAISQTELTVNKVDLIPKLILRKRLAMGCEGTKLDLSDFTTKEDISHFMYYPLNRPSHQAELLLLKSNIKWNQLTELNLSHNRIYSIDAFNLPQNMPKIQHLDLSHNWIEKATILLPCRELNLRSLKLEGNPLCHDYTDPGHYVKVLRMMFPALKEIDGEPVTLLGDLPKLRRNYCPEDAKPIIDKFLEVFFPLLDATDNKDRASIEELYHENATMTITYRHKLRYGPLYRQCRAIFNHSRVIDEGDTDSTDGKEEIARLINKWPNLKHDPLTFTVDVMLHDDFLTIFKVTGIMKVTAETLAEDEHLVSFARTIVLHSVDGVEYKVANEMVYWDQPTTEYANTSFRITTVRPKRLSLKLESPPDEDLKEKLVDIFVQLTELDKAASERCLEHRDWNLKQALEYFMKLIKLDEIEILSKGLK